MNEVTPIRADESNKETSLDPSSADEIIKRLQAMELKINHIGASVEWTQQQVAGILTAAASFPGMSKFFPQKDANNGRQE